MLPNGRAVLARSATQGECSKMPPSAVAKADGGDPIEFPECHASSRRRGARLAPTRPVRARRLPAVHFRQVWHAGRTDGMPEPKAPYNDGAIGGGSTRRHKIRTWRPGRAGVRGAGGNGEMRWDD